MKKHTKNYDELCECIDSTIISWSKADKISVLEQREEIQKLIYGIVRAALYVLSTDEYFEFTQYVHSKGFNH